MDVVTVGVVCADVMVRPVDSIPERGQLQVVPGLDVRIGGLAGVTATVLSTLGMKTGFIGKLGQDGFGDYIQKTLEDAGVDCSLVVRTSEGNTSASVVLIESSGDRAFLHHIGTNALLTDADIDVAALSGVKVIHWGGPGISPGLEGEPMARVYAAARAQGIATSMDTCYDGQGKWGAHIEASLPHLDIAMTSMEEAPKYTGREHPEAIADYFLEHGAKMALIKRGGDGMLAKSADATVDLPAYQVEAVDTTGAGDAACAGFLYGVVHGWDLERTARMANAVGALTVQAMGGAGGVKSLDAVLELMES